MRPDRTTPGASACGARGLVALPELMAFAIVLTGGIARVAEEHDLTPMQGRLLCGLADHPRRMMDLAQLLGVEKAALTGLVDRAERRGLVERAPVPGDRRVVQVALTADGADAVGAFEAGVVSALDTLLEPLPAADRAEFRRMASVVVGAAQGGDGGGLGSAPAA